MPFIPDKQQNSDGFIPDEDQNVPSWIPDKPQPVSFKQKVKNFAKDNLINSPLAQVTHLANKVSNKVDPVIEKFRNETLPNTLGLSEAGIEQQASQTGKVPYGKIVGRLAVQGAGNVLYPTTKEAAVGATLGGLMPGIKTVGSNLLEKISPKYAASQTVKREVGALGKIASNIKEGGAGQSTGMLQFLKPGDALPQAREKTPLLQTIKLKNGNTIVSQAAKGHAGVYNELAKLNPELPNSVALNQETTGVINKAGEFKEGSVSGRVAKKSMAYMKENGLKPPSPEIHQGFIDEVMKELNPPTVKSADPIFVQQARKQSASKAIIDRLAPEETALKRQGKTGTRLADLIINNEENSQVMAGKAKESTIPKLLELPTEDLPKIADYIEPRFGNPKPTLSPEGTKVAQDIKQKLTAFGKFLEKQDIVVKTSSGDRPFYAKNDFFPRMPDFEALKNPEKQALEIKHLIKTGQATNQAEARDVIKSILDKRSPILDPQDFSGFSSLKKVGTIEKPRIYNLLNVDQDPVKNLTRYFDSVSKRIHTIKNFGQTGDKLNQMLADISSEGGDAELAAKIANRVLGREHGIQSSNYLVNEAKAFQTLTKLSPGSSLANMQQGTVNSYIRTGSPEITAQGFKNSFTKDGISFARKAGVVDNSQIDKYMEEIGGIGDNDVNGPISNLAGKYTKAIGFKTTETANRVQAANIGKLYMEDLAKRVVKNPADTKAIKELRNYGIANIDQLVSRGRLTNNEVLKAVNRFVGETQFATRPLAQPHIFQSSSLGKLMGQYAGFPIGQSRLIMKAQAAHPLTAARVAGSATAVGLPIEMLRRKLSGQPAMDKKNITLPGIVGAAIKNSGALGKIGSVIDSANYGAGGPAKALLGPTGSDLSQLIYALAQAGEGKKTALGRMATKMIPAIGPALSRKLFPTKGSR